MATPVQVLLPLYDAGPWLAPLVRSLLDQQLRPASVLVRDDGSSDGSLDRLLALCAGGGLPVRVLPAGPRLGPFRSFLTLLEAADPDVLVAFADQDDVWFPDKLTRAVRALQRAPRVACYGTAVQVTDAALTPLSVTAPPPGGPSFGHALFENLAPAASLVLTPRLRGLLVERLPRTDVYPDLWCYQVASGVGTVVHETAPSLAYRQHGGNAVGVGTSRLGVWRRRLSRLTEGEAGLTPRHWSQLQELQERFGDLLRPPDAALLSALLATRASWRRSARYALRGAVVRRSRVDAAVLRAALLLPR